MRLIFDVGFRTDNEFLIFSDQNPPWKWIAFLELEFLDKRT